jgi:hypothetical protein
MNYVYNNQLDALLILSLLNLHISTCFGPSSWGIVCICKAKAIQLQALTGPKGSRRLRLPDFKTIGTWWWQGCQPYAPAALPPGSIPGTHFCLRLSEPQGQSATGRITSMKNSNGTNGNRTRDLPFSSAVWNQMNGEDIRKVVTLTGQSSCSVLQ